MPKTTHPLHFEDLSWNEFERMVFAYIGKLKQWDRFDWYGQKGGDKGRDIWGEFAHDTYCYQCANYRKLDVRKAVTDIDKLVKNQLLPKYFILICGGHVSAKTRTKIYEYANFAGIENIDIWDGPKLEEKLRAQAPDLIRRFFWADNFPEIHQQAVENQNVMLDHISVQNNEVLELLRKMRPVKEQRVAILPNRSAYRTGILIQLAGKRYDRIPMGNPFKDIVATVILMERFIAESEIAAELGLSTNVSQVFFNFFRSDVINKDFFVGHIEGLVFLVFGVDEIENREPVNLKLVINNAHSEFQFSYPQKIFEFILFELLVNAKTNRWISIDDDFVNNLEIAANVEANSMKVTIRNTCPKVSYKKLALLNSADNMNAKNEMSGIYLIKLVLNYFNIGTIQFRIEEIDANLCWFIVELILPCWHE